MDADVRVQSLTPFQELVCITAELLIRRRIPSSELVIQHIYQVTLTNPVAMRCMDTLGWQESSWSLDDQKSTFDAVRANMRFRERRFFFDKKAKMVTVESKK